MHASLQVGSVFFYVTLLVVAGCSILYLYGVNLSNSRFQKWPWYKTLFWLVGLFGAGIVLVGPFGVAAHEHFSLHMVGHLVLGMLSPLLMVLAAPMTLLLRLLPVSAAKKMTGILRSSYVQFLHDPIVASILNIGGLWILYTTPLFELMHHSFAVYLIVHLHVFVAGYLFTSAMIYIDPIPHRRSFLYRAWTLIIALAGHAILSKWIYANPPNGIPAAEAELGGMLMYYGGDLIDGIIILLLCYQWYKAHGKM